MSLWNHIPQATQGNFGLAPKKWYAQIEAIRALPEAKKP
jgi:hypothetical protein